MFSWVKLNHMAEWCEGRYVGLSANDVSVSGISTDTRTLVPGELFVALSGPNFDGHRFVDVAVEKGAIALIAQREVPTRIPLIVVGDTLAALVNIARNLRNHFRGRVIAVTGSAGKSSTKEMAATLLGGNAVRSPASFNNLLGVSKTLFLLEDSTDFLVLELGMNAPGEIRVLCDHFKPEAGLITNIGDAHIGKLGGKEQIYAAKKELFASLAQAAEKAIGVVLNVDDSLVKRAYAETFTKPVKTVTYSAAGQEADVVVREKRMDPATGFLSLKVSVRRGDFTCRVPIFGAHQAQNLAAAIGAAVLFEQPLAEIRKRLGGIRPAPHRGEIFTLSQNRILIDESYNSNPTALVSALTTLAQMDPNRRKLLILGDMLELGEFSRKLHKDVGETLVQLYARQPIAVLGVGDHIKSLLAIVKAKNSHVPCEQSADVTFARPILERMARPGDILFIKGSRGVNLDQLVTHLVQK